MLRDKNLIPLSHQHQHALALCVRIERASPIAAADLAAWQSEIAQIVQNEIAVHFAAEEQVLFPAARRFQELQALIGELLAEHSDLRSRFTAATEKKMSDTDVLELAQALSAHIRKEERQLFERVQELMNSDELSSIGKRLEEALKAAPQVCTMPTGATRPKPKGSR